MDEECTVNKTVKYLTKKWSLLIILELYKGKGCVKRFSDLKSSLNGITPKVLSQRLKELEDEGLVEKKVITESFPVKTEYALTQSGLEIVEIIKSIKKWALKWKIDNIECGEQNCRDCIL
ncbi:helix-turn-helix transcriptional regulator [Methanoplanus sp. FWC-SCC4]|uniref:Helix-turn-helix transcriptional regulator n=1 Tax=Methanochimaera problematica TaxID=2609417 RepID=A0AA97I3K8_9EURY|nr:helix-turn-helix domain-containing protein [Methanoplanus sp. FWC-SCC4]WOF15659.1 helix-turn-helix transcriptional regulator [Methanoplanus sp. FWC-SCC4]